MHKGNKIQKEDKIHLLLSDWENQQQMGSLFQTMINIKQKGTSLAHRQAYNDLMVCLGSQSLDVFKTIIVLSLSKVSWINEHMVDNTFKYLWLFYGLYNI